MKVYSPSQTQKFLECPAEWWLYKQGWRKRWMNRGSLAAVLGSGFHRAIGEYYVLQRAANVEDIVSIARAEVDKELTTYHELGFEVGTRDLDLEAALPAKVEALVRFYLSDDPIPTDWQYDTPELQLHDYGYCKIDLPVIPRPGADATCAPLDWKVKLRMDPKYAWKTKEEWAYSWQFMHYAWALGQHTKVPVKEFYVVWVSLEPKPKRELLDYYIDSELMRLWEHSARAAWAVMAAMEGDYHDLLKSGGAFDKCCEGLGDIDTPFYPYHNFQWFTRWGKSDFTEAFLDYKLHDDLMKEDYINIGDRRL